MQSQERERFQNKVAVVTGSTRGIGAAIAKRLASEGASVVVSGLLADEGETVVETIHKDIEGDATFVKSDVRDPDAVSALVDATAERYGQLDVLVNNAAIETETSAEELTVEEWERVVNTDFRGYWLCAKYAYEQMDTGSIINVSSNHSFLTMPAMFPYNAVKAGVDGMTRALALDFGPNVRVNSVNPGWVAVDRITDSIDETRRRDLKSIHPVGRIGRPEDIAAAVAYLASDEASFVTGASLTVDGGRQAVMEDGVLPDYRERRR